MKKKTRTTGNPMERHIYDNAIVRDVINDERTKKIGEYSIIYLASSAATVENLTDWYFNYVMLHNYNWCMILYTDSIRNQGVYAIAGVVDKDVFFEQDEYGDYALLEPLQEILYLPVNGTLVNYSDKK